MAARFLGTKTSSFTLAISEERRGIFGHAADTNEEMDDLPAEEMKQAPPPRRRGERRRRRARSTERIAALGRYLLFDVAFHEQLNKQRRALMFYLHLAMRLKRTLVLPRRGCCRGQGARGSQFEAEAEYMRWGELFNVSALNKLHPAVELEEFLRRRGRCGAD